jgi:hypothetical protein
MAPRRPLPPVAPALAETAPQEKTGHGAFHPCATCGVLLLTHTWHTGRGWVALEVPISPVFGNLHQSCDTHHDEGA